MRTTARFYQLMTLAAMMCLLSSCFTTYQVESAKRVSNEDAHLVIYRDGVIGFAVGTKVFANGQFVGKVGANRYISCWMPAGEYLMSIRMDRTDEVFFKVRMVAGRTYSYSFSYGSLRDGGRPRIEKMIDASVLNRRRPPLVNYFD
jgi:hypothetical protein